MPERRSVSAAGRNGSWDVFVKRVFFRHGALVLSSLLLQGVGKAIATWAIARWQGAAALGAFTLAIAGMSFGASLFTGGIDYANSYLAGRTAERVPVIAWNSLVVFGCVVLITPAFMAGYAAIFPEVVHNIGGSVWFALVIMAFATALMTLRKLLHGVAIGRQMFVLDSYANVVWGLSWTMGALIGAQMSYFPLLWAWLLAVVPPVLVYVAALRPRRPIAKLVNQPVLLEQLRDGIQTLPGTVARALNLRASLYVLAVFVPASSVGVFGAVLAISEAFLYLPKALSQVVLGQTASGAYSKLDQRMAYLVVVSLGIAAVVATIIWGEPLLTLVFGSEFAAGSTALPLLLGAVTIHAIGLIRLHHLLGSGNPLAATYAQLITLLFTVSAGLLLIPRWGLDGAAFATLIAYTSFTAYLMTRA